MPKKKASTVNKNGESLPAGSLKIIVEEINKLKRDIGNLNEEIRRAKGTLERNKDLVQQKAEGQNITVVFNDGSDMSGLFVRQTHYNINLEVDGKEKIIFKHSVKYFEVK